MKKRINYKLYFNIIEKILFLLLLFVVIVIASGYKYDPVKRELIQTGVLKIENLEDFTRLSFNNNNYENKNNLSISLLEQNKYVLKIDKKDRKEYSTNVNIKQGEVTYINPVLISTTIKPNLIRENVKNLTFNNESIYYTYIDNNINYLERVNLSKTIFNADVNKTKIDITQALNKEEIISVYAGNSNNFALIKTTTKILLLDFNKLLVTDITNSLPTQKIIDIKLVNDTLFLQYEDTLYSINISDITKIQRYLVFTGKNYSYTVDENNVINIIYKNSADQIILEKYSLNGVLQQKITLKSTFQLDNASNLVYFYKNLYLQQGTSVYKIVDDELVDYQKDVKKFKIIDRNNLLTLTSDSAKILSRERQIIYTPFQINNINELEVLPDLFTFIYIDSSQLLHLADFGGQDNIILQTPVSNTVTSQNGSDTYILYSTGTTVNYILFGNDNK